MSEKDKIDSLVEEGKEQIQMARQNIGKAWVEVNEMSLQLK